MAFRCLTAGRFLRRAYGISSKKISEESRDLIVQINAQMLKDSTFANELAAGLSKEQKNTLAEVLKVESCGQIPAASAKRDENTPPTNRQLLFHSIRNGVPFIGFGFLDNAIMIIAGEYIDTTVGVSLGISTMAAAGIGNWVSDIAGLGVGGFIEAFVNKLRIPDPKMSWFQLETRKARIAKSAGNMVGITIGCFLGMAPLLFY